MTDENQRAEYLKGSDVTSIEKQFSKFREGDFGKKKKFSSKLLLDA